MSDTQTAPKTWTAQSTLNTAGGLTGLAIVSQYINDSFAAGHLVAPGLAVIGVALTVIAPVAHLIGRIVMFKLSQADKGDTQP